MASEVALVALRLAVSARRAVRMTVASVVTLAPVTCATSVRWKLTSSPGSYCYQPPPSSAVEPV